MCSSGHAEENYQTAHAAVALLLKMIPDAVGVYEIVEALPLDRHAAPAEVCKPSRKQHLKKTLSKATFY